MPVPALYNLPTMKRRSFLLASGAASLAMATPTRKKAVTVLCDDRTVVLDKVRPDATHPEVLWVRSADLPSINDFHVKPEGACRADTCIPITKEMKSGEWFNLSAFAHKLHQPVVMDSGVWSFGEMPVLRGDFYGSRIAPDFAVPDRKGKVVHLSDFRGKKVLIVTWASWRGCRFDLPGWQKVYSELKARNFEIIAAAQDTGGEAAAGKWYDAAKATFTTLIDKQHSVSTVYQFVNVPTGMWIDERGKVVRPAEPAWTSDGNTKYGEKFVSKQGESYVAGLRDWVTNGERSRYALSDDEFRKRVKPRSAAEMEADASFKLAVWFHENQQPELAAKYWQRAQELNPDDWNYARQDWSFTPEQAGKKWMEKLQKTDKEYYPKLDLPQ